MSCRTLLAIGCMAVPMLSSSAFALPTPAISMAVTSNNSPNQPAAVALSLQAAINLALAQHPDLSASQFNLDAAQAGITKAQQRPNPELLIESENLGQTSQTISSQWVQRLELGGKLERRVTVAEREYQRSTLIRDLKKTEIVAQVRAAYMQAILSYQQLANQQTNQQLMQKWASSIQQRVDAGKASPLEAERAVLAASAAQDLVQRAKHECRIATDQLSLAIGQRQAFDFSGSHINPLPIPPWEQIKPLLNNSLGLQLLNNDIEQQEAEMALQQSLSTQDIQISAGLKHTRETGDNGVLLGVSVPLPLLNRNQGGIRQAELRVQASRAQYQSQTQAFEVQAFKLWGDLHSLQTTIRLYDEQLLPGAERNFQKAHEGYQVGKFSFMDMLDAQRSLLSIQADRFQQLKRYAELEGQLYALIGDILPLDPSITSGSKP